MASNATIRNRSHKGRSESFVQQRDLIAQCARTCFERKGVHKTTFVDIAREADITRELIYYYFSGKEEIVGCVVDSYMQDAVETMRLWCDQWEASAYAGAMHGRDMMCREAAADAVASIRRFVFQQDGSRRSMFAVLDEIGQRGAFFDKMCEQILLTAAHYGFARRIKSAYAGLSDDELVIAFKIVLMGSIRVMEGTAAREDARIVNLLLSCVH